MDNISAKRLAEPGALLKETWVLFKSKFWVIAGLVVGVYLFSFLVATLASILIKTGENLIFQIMVIFSMIVVTAAVATWMEIALIIFIKEREKNLGIREALSLARGKIVSAWLVSLLVFLSVSAGLLLFIVPGIIFAVWFMFSMYALVVEGCKGSKALARSRELVRGHWSAMLWRNFYVLFVLGVIGFFIISLGDIFFGSVSFVVEDLVSFFIAVMTTIYSLLLFENLKELRTSQAAL